MLLERCFQNAVACNSTLTCYQGACLDPEFGNILAGFSASELVSESGVEDGSGPQHRQPSRGAWQFLLSSWWLLEGVSTAVVAPASRHAIMEVTAEGFSVLSVLEMRVVKSGALRGHCQCQRRVL